MEVHGGKTESDNKNNSTGTEKTCQPCEFKHLTTKANGICLECEEFMCNTCFRNHLTGKMCRHHELIDMDRASLTSEKSKETEEKCQKHDNEPVKFYCRTHDSVGCGDCIILEHSNCNPEYIMDFKENKEFEGLLRKLDQLQSTNRANDEKIQNNRKDIKVMHEDALKEIRKFRVDINKYLDKVEADIIRETEQLKRDNDKLLDKLQQECERLSCSLETLKQKLNTDIYRKNVVFIHAINCKPIVKTIEQEVAKVLSENRVKQFKFIPDEQLVKIVTSTRKFGCLNISESKLSAGQESAMSLNEAEKHTVHNIDSRDKEKDVRPAGVREGVRVRAVTREAKYHSLSQPGTVTAVRSDGRVDVDWDATDIIECYFIGRGRQVELI